MLINEACKECKLTKKAIEYYGQQGLISPSLMENGYRQFSVADVEKLKKISTLRKLGLSVAEIGAVLKNEDLSTLDNIIHKKDAEIADLKAKQGLIQQLANTQNWEDIQEKLDILQSKQSILKRLREAFPGCYGKFFSSHFAAYLNEPIATAQQQEAYETIIRFLDTVSIEIPDDLKDFLDEVTMATDDNVLQKTQDNLGYCQELCANTTASLMKLVRRRPNRPRACSAWLPVSGPPVVRQGWRSHLRSP